jgi:hypothetical protein
MDRKTLARMRSDDPNSRDIVPNLVQIRLGSLLQISRRAARHVMPIDQIPPREASHDNPRQEQHEDLEPDACRWERGASDVHIGTLQYGQLPLSWAVVRRSITGKCRQQGTP